MTEKSAPMTSVILKQVVTLLPIIVTAIHAPKTNAMK
jgi:hypothetical protein